MKKLQSFIQSRWLLVLAVFILVNIAASNLLWQWDLTAAKRHSLSEPTEQLVASLNAPVTIRYYMSRSENVMPFQLRTYAEKVDYFLTSLQRQSGGKVRVVRIDPVMASDLEKDAKFDGIDGRFSSEKKRFYFGLSLSSLEKKVAIPFLHPDREDLLEYDLVRTIENLTTVEHKTIGLISSLPVLGGQYTNDRGKGQFPAWVFIEELKKSYYVKSYLDNTQALIEKPPALLLLIHPVGLPESTLRHIDQYLAYGGKIIVMLDPFSSAIEMIDTSLQGKLMSSNVEQLLSAWGVSYKPTEVVSDRFLGSQINRGHGTETSHSVLNITQRFIHTSDSISAGVNHLGFAYAGHFAPQNKQAQARMVPLVSTSAESNVIDAAEFIDLSREKNLSLIEQFQPDGRRRVLVAKLLGPLPRAFADTVPSRLDVKPEELVDGESRAILFADVDMIFDPFAGESVALSKSINTVKPYNGNLALFANAVEHLIGHNQLGELRGKGGRKYPLAGLAAKVTTIDAGYAQKRASLQAERRALEEQLTVLTSTIDKNDIQLYTQANKDINYLSTQLQENSQALDGIDHMVERQVNSLKNRAQWLVMLLPPVIIFAFGVALITRRSLRTRAQ